MKEAASTDKKYSGAKWSVLFFAGIIILWQLLIPMFGVPDYLMPTPWRVVEEFGKRGSVILANLVPTFEVTILGFLIGAVVGISSGIGIVYSRFLWLTVYPALVLVSSVPRIAIAPLILIWFGIDSLLSKVIISFLVAFFPMLINSVVGLSQVSPDMIDLGKTMGMSRIDEFKKIRLPNSVPFLFAGFKASIALAVIGAVVAEFVAGERGLGFLIIVGFDEMNSSIVFASIIVLAAMSLGMFGILVWLEKVLMPWRQGIQITEM
jgi:NitT/TauT family transport system permease protein